MHKIPEECVICVATDASYHEYVNWLLRKLCILPSMSWVYPWN